MSHAQAPKSFILYERISKKTDLEMGDVLDLFRKAAPYEVSSITNNVDNVSEPELAELFSSVLNYISQPNNMFVNRDGEIILYFEGIMPDNTKHAALISSVKLNRSVEENKRIYIYQLTTSPYGSAWDKPEYLMAMFLYSISFIMQKHISGNGVELKTCSAKLQSIANKNRIKSKISERIKPTIVSANFIDTQKIFDYINANGSKKSYHHVRGHERKLQSGRIIFVKPHTRGNTSIGENLQFYEVKK